MNSRNRPKSRVILSSPITLIIAMIILVVFVRAAAKIHARSTESSTRLADMQSNLAELESKKIELTDRIQNLSTEEGIEASIREKYHAVRPGESVAVIVNIGKTDKASVFETGITGTSTELNSSWLQKILRAIGL